ncbi:MAG: CHASE2 domain-containing protein [Phycisphaerales bacterium]|nr:CHASE2 domain-containing protein [Phycisphaerales bacterium]
MWALWNWARIHRWGLIVGIGMTVLTAALFVTGVFSPMSLYVLDYKFQKFGTIAADPSIVMVDIDDYALERVEAWPWPRRRHADLIRVLDELGARAVLMDIVFSEPTGGRIEDPRLNADQDVDPREVAAGELSIDAAVWDDNEFVEALRDAGNVFLGLFAKVYNPGFPPQSLRARVYAILDHRPNVTFEQFDVEMGTAFREFVTGATPRGRDALQFDARELFDAYRMEHLLQREYLLDNEATTARLGLTRAFVNRHFGSAKRNVARRLTWAYLTDHPGASWAESRAHFMPGVAADHYDADRADLLRAYRAISGERYVVDSAIAMHSSFAGRVPHADDLTLPVDKFAAVAGAGMVTFETGADGVMRRVPLVAEARGRMLKHLGFATACAVLGIDEKTIQHGADGSLVMATGDGLRRWRIPVDANGRTLINWHIDRSNPTWSASFTHLSVTRLMAVPELRRAIEYDEGRLANDRLEFVRASAGDAAARVNDYIAAVNERKALRWSAVTDADRARLAELELQTVRIEKESTDHVVGLADEVRQAVADGLVLSDDNPEDVAAKRALELADRHGKETPVETFEAGIASKRASLDRLMGELRPRFEGKICLLGYTASAVADTVNSPVFDEMPGVLAHANVINSILADRFPSEARPWMMIAAIALAGLAVTVITAWRDLWFSLATMLLLAVALEGASFAAFYAWTVHIEMEAAAVGAACIWAAVTGYRQLVEERHKRAFSTSLAQYTSPAIAAQLATQLSQRGAKLDLSPVPREVTCFFSDLKGFTSISERLGASRTREVLNPYLEAMSKVLIDHQAMINKFMGDGIFAFFNPPLMAVEGHAQAACEAALGSFAALEELKDRMGHGELEKEVRALSMRVGLNSGEVFVGDYGSGSKLDYTCIGDTVNLAARLEPACKPFGIQCLISETTYRPSQDKYVVRHLGGLQVVGKKQAVQVYELIGRRGEVDGEKQGYAALFGQAVTRFQARDWNGALTILEKCRAKRSDDLAVDLLTENVEKHHETPPPDDWNQAIELTSK